MGSEGSNPSSAPPQPIQNLQITHLGPVTLMHLNQQYCLLKVFSYSDHFLMQDRLRKLKSRTNKPNNSVLNIYQAHKQEHKELCAHNYQLLTYIERPDSCLKETITKKLQLKKNYTEEELYSFLGKTVDSLIYLQDNGLKNIHLDGQSIVFCGENVKILDTGLACSKTYFQLLQHRQKEEKCQECVYLAPQLLKELQGFNYDPYISPKADIFSLGMLLMQMIALEPMQGYYDYSKASIDYDSLIHRLSRITHSLTLKTLIAEMLEYDPEERIGLLSLKQKVQRLRMPTEQGITRSKSSKMLQEILSQSRRSSSICKQSDQSGSLTRQPSSQKKVIPRIELRCSAKKVEEHYRIQTEPSAVPLTTRQENNFQEQTDPTSQYHLKNLVKSKLSNCKDKDKSKLYKPFKQNTPILPQPRHPLQIRNILDQSKRSNFFASSIRSRKDREPIKIQQYKENVGGPKTTLHKLVDSAGIRKLLKLEQLEVSQKQSQAESLKNTSRFGSNQQQANKLKKSRPSDIYIHAYKEEDSNLDTDQFKHPQPQRTLQKVMTFNKEFLLNAKNTELSVEEPHKFTQQPQQQLQFSPISSYQCKNLTPNIETKNRPIILKDIPVVISQEKSYLRPPPPHFGKLQRQLNIMECTESIQQSPSLNSSFNTSNVIQSYRPQDEDSSSIQQEMHMNETAVPFKKPRSKKPQLMIKLADQEQVQTPSTLPLTFHHQKPSIEHYSKTIQSVQHLSNFTSISPPKDNKDSHMTDLFHLGFSPSVDQQFPHRYKLPNNEQYQGQMLSELPHGNGVLYQEGKISYSGSFKLGKFSGYGTLYNFNFSSQPVDHKHIDLSQNYWNRFQGQFQSGLMNGFGTVFFPDGEKFSGCLNQGIIDGYGCFYRKNGELISGLWSQNKYRKV